MLASNTITTYTMNYMGTFGMHSLGIPASKAFGATVAVGVCATCGALFSGWSSDRWGRKPVMIGGTLLLLLLGLPCFAAMSQMKSLPALVVGSGMMALATGLYGPAVLAGLSESLPASLRAGSLGIIYALAICCFGGSAQFVVTWLIQITGSPLAPAWHVGGAAAGPGRHDRDARDAPASAWLLIALSCQRRSRTYSKPDKAAKIAMPASASNSSAANKVAISSRLPDSTMRQARPVAVPDPATNSATTAPIKARPPAVFMPDSRYGKAPGKRMRHKVWAREAPVPGEIDQIDRRFSPGRARQNGKEATRVAMITSARLMRSNPPDQDQRRDGDHRRHLQDHGIG